MELRFALPGKGWSLSRGGESQEEGAGRISLREIRPNLFNDNSDTTATQANKQTNRQTDRQTDKQTPFAVARRGEDDAPGLLAQVLQALVEGGAVVDGHSALRTS